MSLIGCIINSTSKGVEYATVYMPSLLQAMRIIEFFRVLFLQIIERAQTEIPQIFCDRLANTRNNAELFQGILLLRLNHFESSPYVRFSLKEKFGFLIIPR